ncbi:NAD(P)/FAD-dependent oxidoreductase [uncultured Sphingomonas sp.]|uniref:NAD(P)/FAD-dependent oxidoreductase n=1 Tax=uncultured Sphingomonas sp. TaxID=158754 RepID=UPI00263235D6|nr:NAD(P)/FAD-dependent oxidoreductase [uncultured Sphingomonas sp.]
MYEADSIVVGGGVVGLAIARALALAGREPIVVDSEKGIGMVTSSRNSEVIHAGLYYPEGSLKAALCVRGKALLYEFCAARGVPHRRCGKILVATSADQIGGLDPIVAAAAKAGVDDLRPLDRADLHRIEPALAGVAGLFSPSTGIVDSHALMLALQGEAEANGAQVVLASTVDAIEAGDGDVLVTLAGDEAPSLRTPLLINAAGLGAQALARTMGALAPDHIPALHYAKGVYFALSGRAPFSHLVYPLPEPGGLGVHLTLDMAGAARFGPDVEWIDTIDYDVDPARADRFYGAIRRYWPDLPDGALAPAYAGIRPKISAPGEPAADFCISRPRDHGVAGLINLFGIESPGLTSSLAIGEHVAAMVRQLG